MKFNAGQELVCYTSMINRVELKTDLRNSTNHLLGVLYETPGRIYNEMPRGNSWTIGMVAQHLIKVETSTVRLFAGMAEPTERNPESKINTIKSRLLDHNTKMRAFGPIIPDENLKDKQALIEKLQDLRQRMMSCIEIEDLTETVTGFEHPLFGFLTRVEWIYFNIYHAERHVRQINEISKKLQD